MHFKLYKYRFELFLGSLLFILFGSLIFPFGTYEEIVIPILYIINIFIGILLISKEKKLTYIFWGLLITSIVIFGDSFLHKRIFEKSEIIIRLIIYLIFYGAVTISTIKQIWATKTVDRKVILGLMCGYISLGLIAFFIFITIETISPNSFTGLDTILIENTSPKKQESLLYYSFITLFTIGYGDISPLTVIAQKATILTGLMGQFYIVIVTAVVVGKYISQLNSKKYK